MISVCNVSKSFGSIKALDNISFIINPNETVGFLGPNGAGKTTLMRLLVGTFPPSKGNILIDSKNLTQSKQLRKKIGYLAEHNPLYREMTVLSFLKYVAALKGIPWLSRKKAVLKVSEQCSISQVFNRIIGKLSKGYQQRVGLAQALLGDPEVLILDEPTNGLDPQQIIEMRNLIRQLGRDQTIILSTHILPEVQMMCQRILILNEGRLIASGSPQDLNQNMKRSDEFLIHLKGNWGGGEQFLKNMPDVIEIVLERESGIEREYRIRARQGSQIRSQIARLVVESGYELLGLKDAAWSLEEVFLKLVTDEKKENEACPK